MKILARVLILIGAALIAAGHRIDKPEPPAAKCVIILPRRKYYHAPLCPEPVEGPSRWEVTRLGLAILFNSVQFGIGV